MPTYTVIQTQTPCFPYPGEQIVNVIKGVTESELKELRSEEGDHPMFYDDGYPCGSILVELEVREETKLDRQQYKYELALKKVNKLMKEKGYSRQVWAAMNNASAELNLLTAMKLKNKGL